MSTTYKRSRSSQYVGKGTPSKYVMYKKKSDKADKALKKVNQLARQYRPEKKYDLSYNALSTVDYNGYTSALMTNNQGVTNAQHIGDRISLQSVKFVYQMTQGGAGAYSTVRVLLYVDKANISPGANVWSVTGSAIAPMAPLSRAYSKDLIILLDETIDQTSGGDSGIITKVHWIPLNGRTVQFNANTNTIMANQLRIAAISDVAPAGAKPQILWTAEVLYTDC